MKINFEDAPNGLVPAIIQDSATQKVVMLGFMNEKALKKSKKKGKVVFYDKSKAKARTYGKKSGNTMQIKKILPDCNGNAILVKVIPSGEICHKGKNTCFNEKNVSDDFLFELEKIVADRKNKPIKSSYTSRMFARGVNYIVKKFGEESFELAIEAKDSDDTLFKAEAADVLYFFTVMIVERKIPLADILDVLKKRRR